MRFLCDLVAEGFAMGSNEFIYVFMSKEIVEKRRNCQHRKTLLRIEFKKFNARFSILAVYLTFPRYIIYIYK